MYKHEVFIEDIEGFGKKITLMLRTSSKEEIQFHPGLAVLMQEDENDIPWEGK